MSASRPQAVVPRPRSPQEEPLIPPQHNPPNVPEGTTLLAIRPSPPQPTSTSRSPSPTTPKEPPPRTRRLAWLDALRGIAALCVVFSHLTPYVLQRVHNAVYTVFDPGLCGVLVFFLVSGYIVPASLERKGSIRSFWVSRAFRLFPLFIVAVAAALLLHAFGLASLRGTQQNPASAIFAHMFMLGDLLGGSDVIVVLWTLSYEMTFYLLLTALFTSGLHRRSGRLAAGFAAGALLLGGVLPTFWLDHSSLGFTRVAIGADILVGAGLALAVAGNRISRRIGAWLAAATALVLLAVNERQFAYEGLAILAVMFTGTLLYRAERGQVNRVRAVLLSAGIFATIIAAGVWHIPPVASYPNPATQQLQWVLSVAAAGLTFAVGFALRNLRIPVALAWLGVVSYSVYLLHPLFIDGFIAIPWTRSGHSLPLQALAVGCFVAAVLACCALTYYLVEAPMQRLGRRAAARLDTRFGPDRLIARARRLTAGVSPT